MEVHPYWRWTLQAGRQEQMTHFVPPTATQDDLDVETLLNHLRVAGYALSRVCEKLEHALAQGCREEGPDHLR